MTATRRLAAIVVADVVGYSRLMEANEAGTLAALKERRKTILEPVVKAHGGRIVKVMGDGVLIEFASAVNAVKAALELQEKFSQANAEQPEERRILLRIGINLGDVVGDGSDIYGDGVNIASRLEALAAPGGVCISGKVNDEVRGKTGAVFADIGERTLKNIVVPVRVFSTHPEEAAVASVAALSARASIAVLPFLNMSGDPEQDYFVDGMVEDIITELSRFRSLFVIARNSSFVYKGRAVNVADVGRALGVHYVAEGSVRRAGNRLRVTVQLIDAANAGHLWAERFDRQLEDVFAVQDEITQRIVSSIAPLLEAESVKLARRKPPGDLQAYDYYLKAKELIEPSATNADLMQARDYCDRAIKRDPAYARAHAYKALSCINAIFLMESVDVEELRRQALFHAERAVALDPMDAKSHWMLAEAAFYSYQPDLSLRHLARALSLNPNDADVLAISTYLHAACGKMETALAHMEMARERNPTNPAWYHWANGGTLHLMGRYEDAIAAFKLFGQPNPSILRWRAVTYVRLGRIEEARADMKALLAQRPDLNAREVRKFIDYLPNAESYMDALREAGLPE